MFEPNQRVKVNLSGGARDDPPRITAEPPTYVVELLFSFKGVKRVEVPEERIWRA